MKKYRFLSALLLIAVLFSLPLPVRAAQEDLELFCTHAVLLDANHGEILYDKGANERAYPASTTKLTTFLLVMEAVQSGQLTLQTPITAGDTAYQGLTGNFSTANIKIGETLTVEELLYCLMLPSANEAANILAVAVDGSIEAFVEHMNRRASELGCRGTHFTNPHGLHSDEHYTTAYDLALTMQACLEHEMFQTVTRTPKHIVPATNLSGEREIYNGNGLVSSWRYGGYLYDKCIGGKTGTTDEAGRCLVSAAEDGDEVLISVILGSGPMEVLGEEKPKQGQFRESQRLLEYGFNNFQRVTITRGDEPVDTVKVTMSRQADEVNVKPQGSITKTLPKSMNLDDIETDIHLFAKEVEAPVEAGEVMGVMTLSYDGEVYGKLDLVAVTSVERSELLHKKQQFFDFLQTTGVKIAAAAVALIAAVIVLRLLVFRKRRRPARSGRRVQSRGNYRGTRR
ncbi:D-alanyl-D-alanine carboxypeptidase [Colidextribacter sp. OB.20]|uniref:D-alanyl-D-alanine carboxypeptidase family protein n=1 Tax=Colidextribacter sp. OB.20 TaxID=2304568 RepID=UPI00137115D6|nr:D-alanyl-D-alanine carboxypeptidase family protein [Colidextribacter sp. OB.20]NBI09172.1 D-alanyl-D-alanine carboxypeptidase [Colidextribacter sp. OB.20]